MAVTATSNDNIQVVKTELTINNKLTATANSARLSYSWNTSKLSRGSYILQSKAYDSSGNTALSTPITVYK